MIVISSVGSHFRSFNGDISIVISVLSFSGNKSFTMHFFFGVQIMLIKYGGYKCIERNEYFIYL